jgi:uncharacterized protein (TIGR02996 family)
MNPHGEAGTPLDERDALLANVLNVPSDDTARLVLADWLDEHGEGDFGHFVRAGVVASRFDAAELIDDPDYYSAIQNLSDIATEGAPARWLSALGVGPAPLVPGDWVWDNTADRVTVRIGTVAGVFARGLLAELLVPLGVWYEVAPRALVSCPVHRASITDLPGLCFWIEPPTPDRAGWRLTAAVTVQPRRTRRRGIIRLVFGEGETELIPPVRWAAERTFPNRSSLVSEIVPVSEMLYEEVRDAAAGQWPRP